MQLLIMKVLMALLTSGAGLSFDSTKAPRPDITEMPSSEALKDFGLRVSTGAAESL